MKPIKVAWVVALLLVIKVVFAQEIVIGEKTYPLTILIPLLAIAIIWVGILVIYAFKNMQKFSWSLVKINHYIKKSGFRKLPSYVMGLVRKQKKVEAEEPKKQEKKDLTPYIKRFDVLEARLPKISNSEALHDFSEIARDFLSDILGLRHAFTIEEAKAKMKNKRKDLLLIAERISEAKYSGADIAKEETLVMMDKLRKVVNVYIKKGWRQHATSKKLVEKLVEGDKRIFSNIKDYLGVLKREKRKKQIDELLEDERALLKVNIKTIRQSYNRILKLYIQLPAAEREKIYPKLMEFYNNINKAMFSTVYGQKSMKKLEYFSKKLEELKGKPKIVPLAVRLKRLLQFKAEMPSFKLKEKIKDIPVKKVKPEPVKVTDEIKTLKAKQRTVLTKFTKILKRDKLKKQHELDFKQAIKMRKARLSHKEQNVLQKINRITSSPPPMGRVDYKFKLDKLIAKTVKAVNKHNIVDAEMFYYQIKPLYVSLGEVEKKAVLPKIEALHKKIAHLHKLPIKKVKGKKVQGQQVSKKSKLIKGSKKSKKASKLDKKIKQPVQEEVPEQKVDRLASDEKELVDKLNQLRRGL